jgi:hypothetical protein
MPPQKANTERGSARVRGETSARGKREVQSSFTANKAERKNIPASPFFRYNYTPIPEQEDKRCIFAF